MAESSTDWKLFRKLMLILTFFVGLGVAVYFALQSTGVWISRCSEGSYFWLFIPFCRGEANPHEPSHAYVLALGVVFVVWMVKKVRGLLTREVEVAGGSDDS